MLHFPLFYSDEHPEPIDANRDDCQKPPFYPVAKKLKRIPVKRQSAAVYNCVFCFPSVNHNERPWITDSKRADRHDPTENAVSDVLK